MNNLFLIDGAAGTGKTVLIDFVNRKFVATGTATIVHKVTTRPCRKEELKRDLKLYPRTVTPSELEECKKQDAIKYNE